jgi:mono/diheme cytochrome c family protein
VDWASLSEEEAKAKLMVIGELVYTKGGTGGIACMTCHMATGLGVPGAFPPLAGSGEEMGDCEQHANYILKGVTGEVMIQGKKYQGVMPAQANLSDEEIAAVLTYERSSWGNDYGVCRPGAVAAARSKL